MSESKPTAFENFRALTKKVLATPKKEIDEREIKYREARKTKARKKDR
jgi:hypothetical protein